jgi:hypothetical protein
MRASEMKMEHARDMSQSFVDRQVHAAASRAGGRVNEIAEDVRRVARQLRDDSTIPGAASLADRGADAIERFGHYLKEADARRFVADAEALARANPVLAAGLAYMAGLSVSRLLKSGSRNGTTGHGG